MIPPLAQIRRPSLVSSTSAALAEHIQSELSRADGDTWLPSERELAVSFAVSRPVIREATKRLELQGLLEIHHGKGLKMVNQLHRPLSQSLEIDMPDLKDRLRQLHETRLVIEPETARLAAINASAEDISSLHACQDRLEHFATLTDAAEADVEFHHQLAFAAGNHIFALLLTSLAELGQKSRIRTMSSASVQKAHSHHASILQAVEDGNPDEAAEQMRHHLEEASQDLDVTE